MAYRDCFLLVRNHLPIFLDYGKSLTDYRDEQIEQDNHIKDDAQKENNPIDVAIIKQILIELPQSRQEWVFKGQSILAHVLVVPIWIFCNLGSFDNSSTDIDLVDLDESACERQHTQHHDDKEVAHVIETLNDQSDVPVVLIPRTKEE